MRLDLGETGKLALYTSDAILEELDGVLNCKKFVERIAAAVPPVTAASLLQHYAALATSVALGTIERTVPTGAADDMVIATALAASAKLIVTGDSDLLVMHPFHGIRILDSATALDEIRRVTGR